MGRPAGTSAVAALATLLALEATAFLSIRSLRPPDPVPDTALGTEFSAIRAARHVAAIAQAPHPIGSLEHARVRQYIVGELEKLGLSPKVQRLASAVPIGPRRERMTLQNVVGKLPGTPGGPTVLLCAHYDSRPTTPGAADNSSGVATLLETVRALRAGAPLRDDLIVLITDGEEEGCLGGFGYVHQQRGGRDLGLVLNFDARGNSGPSLMFETSQGNARLIQDFVRVAPHPVGNSLAQTVYEWLPNGTDFTAFKVAGVPGLNFAFIDGYPAYHRPADTVENLSQASMQHHGSYALSLTRYFGNLPLDRDELRASSDIVFFNVWSGAIVCYPMTWVLPLAGLACLGCVLIGLQLFRRRSLRPRSAIVGLLLAIVWTVVAPLMIAGLALAIERAARRLGMPTSLPPRGENLCSPLVTLGCLNVALVMTILYRRACTRRTSIEGLWLGHLVIWLGLCLTSAAAAPGGSFLFTWPLLLAFPGYAVLLFGTPAEPPSGLRAFAMLLTAVPTVVLLPQMIYLVYLALVPFTLVGTFAVMFLSIQTITLLLPQLELAAPRLRWTFRPSRR